MALPTSGTLSFSQINVELALPATTNISLNQANVRTLFGVTSGPISFSHGHGKSYATSVAPSPDLRSSSGDGNIQDFYFTVYNVPAGCSVGWEATHDGQVNAWRHWNNGTSFRIYVDGNNDCNADVAMRCYIIGNGSTITNGPWSAWVWANGAGDAWCGCG
jgi:hypothetical protein